jgi:hypothetical protein
MPHFLSLLIHRQTQVASMLCCYTAMDMGCRFLFGCWYIICSQQCLMILYVSVISVVIPPLSLLILIIWAIFLSPYRFVDFIYFFKNQFSVLLIFSIASKTLFIYFFPDLYYFFPLITLDLVCSFTHALRCSTRCLFEVFLLFWCRHLLLYTFLLRTAFTTACRCWCAICVFLLSPEIFLCFL